MLQRKRIVAWVQAQSPEQRKVLVDLLRQIPVFLPLSAQPVFTFDKETKNISAPWILIDLCWTSSSWRLFRKYLSLWEITNFGGLCMVRKGQATSLTQLSLFQSKVCRFAPKVLPEDAFVPLVQRIFHPDEALWGFVLHKPVHIRETARCALRVVVLFCLRSPIDALHAFDQILWLCTAPMRRYLMKKIINYNDWLKNKEDEWISHELSEFIRFLEDRGREQARREVLQQCLRSFLEKHHFSHRSPWWNRVKEIQEDQQLQELLVLLQGCVTSQHVQRCLRLFFRRQKR